MKNSIFLLTLLLLMQRWTAQVTGHILDQEGKPLPGAQIIYKNVGQVIDVMTNSPKIIDGTGRIYKINTDKKGDFLFVGMDYGIYEVTINGPNGKLLYSGKKRIGDNTDPNVSNVLNVDLSTIEANRVEPGGETNLATGKKTKEQMNLIRQENSNAAKINKLVAQFQGALDAQDWASAIDMLHQLIALDANRWEFYQNLGTIQANQSHYQDAAESFAKGVEIAEKALANAANPEQAKGTIGDLLMAEGDAYSRLEKVNEAVALYDKAAAISLHPAMAHYHACNTLNNNGKLEAAIEKCTQAITEDPTQWEFYQVLAGAYNNAEKPKDARETYAKGIEMAKKGLEKSDSGRAKTGLGQMLNSEGNLLVQMKRYDEAAESFKQAAEVAVYPAMPYFNLCATYYNLKRGEEAITACDQAITADPTTSDAYYIKASVLFGEGKVEQNRYIVPPGTEEALSKYLQYAPFGQHAQEVRSMQDKLNSDVDPTYRPPKRPVKK